MLDMREIWTEIKRRRMVRRVDRAQSLDALASAYKPGDDIKEWMRAVDRVTPRLVARENMEVRHQARQTEG